MSKQYSCELQGDNFPLMYSDQRNHIRINSNQRWRFRDKAAVLEISRAEVQLWGKLPSGSEYSCDPGLFDLGFLYGGDVDAWISDLQTMDGYKTRVLYHYRLLVDDESLFGNVQGCYKNKSLSKSVVIRRIKRMVGPSLQIQDETPRSHAEILRIWKAEKKSESIEFVRQTHARASDRHMKGKMGH